MAIEKKSLIPSTSAPKSTASKLANTKKVNDKVSAASALRTAVSDMQSSCLPRPAALVTLAETPATSWSQETNAERSPNSRGGSIMAIEKKSLIPSTPAAKSTASRLATTKKVNDKVNAASALRTAAIRLGKAKPAFGKVGV